MTSKTKRLLLPFALSLPLLLAGCQSSVFKQSGAATATSEAPQGGDELLSLTPLAVTNLNVGQTVQFTVMVGGQPAKPGQLVWTSNAPAVASVNQSGLVTALAPGNAVVRAALSSNPSAYLDFQVTVVSGAPAPTVPAPTPGTGGTFAQQVLNLTNAARAAGQSCGGVAYPPVPPLTYNSQLERAAQLHAEDMAGKNYFSHTSQDGRTFAQRISAAGYPWMEVGENIAAGLNTPTAVVNGWLASPGHCRNIMSASLKELGVGYAYNAASTYGHYWVQDFGRR